MRRLTKTDANLSGDPIDGWTIIRKVAPYLWPKDDPVVKARVVIALSLLLFSKLIAVTTPVVYKWAVDSLAGEFTGPGAFVALGALRRIVQWVRSR